jgi:conserved oligomeric Golgi complex subunit 6
LTGIAYQVFFDTISALGRALLRLTLPVYDTSVAAPGPVEDHCMLLREVLSVYASGLSGDDTDQEQNEGFGKVLDEIIDPTVEFVMATAEQKGRLRRDWDASIYAINSLTYIQVSSLVFFPLDSGAY